MKRDFVKVALAACMILTLHPQLFAVVAKPGTGVYGDEYCHYRKDADGRIQAPARTTGFLRRMPKIESTFPVQGDVRSLVILVNFADVSFVTPDPQEAFRKMLNEPGYSDNGGTGSARDYFIASSDSLFRPAFDVYGPVTLPHERAYYGGKTDRSTQMVVDACDILEHDIDWTLYDENNDGEVDNIFIYFAGHNEAEGGPEDAVWPHRYYVYTEKDGKDIRYYYTGKDGKDYWLWDYACTSELSGEYGANMCGIGTFCHEFSHVLGLDDLYDTKNSDNYTVGAWDIMCYGNYCNDGRTPPSFTAFERFYLGWMTPEQLTDAQDCTLEPIETSNRAYLIASKDHNLSASDPDPVEYWLVENRQRVGWDKPYGCLAGTGLLISHIYWNQKRWDNNTPNNAKPFVFDICEAWYQNPSTTTGTDTYPGQYRVTQFVPTGVNGDILNEHILSNIRVFNSVDIAFHHGANTGSGLFLTPEAPPTMQSTLLNGKRQDIGVDVLQLEGSGIQDTVVCITVRSNSFETSLDSISWGTDTLSVPVAADSTCRATVYVRYKPAIICSSHMGILSAQTANRQQFAQVTLYGISKRATLITPVQALEADSVTPYAFTARWQQQDDAEEYRLAVYTVKEEPLTRKFAPNMRMSQSGAAYSTEYALFPVTALNVSVAQNFSSDKSDYRGCVLIDAFTGSQTWQRVDSVPVRSLSSTVQRQYTFAPGQDCRRFRFTYHTLAGSHYVTLSALSYTLSAQPVYLFPDTVETVFAPAGEFTVTDLQPGTDYYYAVRAAEDKGCEPHVTDMGNSIRVRTIPGPGDSSKQFLVRNLNGAVTAYLPEKAGEDSYLRVFDATGTLLFALPLEEGGSTFVLPVAGLVRGHVYLVKYCPGGRLSRKGLWSKFIY